MKCSSHLHTVSCRFCVAARVVSPPRLVSSSAATQTNDVNVATSTRPRCRVTAATSAWPRCRVCRQAFHAPPPHHSVWQTGKVDVFRSDEDWSKSVVVNIYQRACVCLRLRCGKKWPCGDWYRSVDHRDVHAERSESRRITGDSR